MSNQSALCGVVIFFFRCQFAFWVQKQISKVTAPRSGLWFDLQFVNSDPFLISSSKHDILESILDLCLKKCVCHVSESGQPLTRTLEAVWHGCCSGKLRQTAQTTQELSILRAKLAVFLQLLCCKEPDLHSLQHQVVLFTWGTSSCETCLENPWYIQWISLRPQHLLLYWALRAYKEQLQDYYSTAFAL